MPPTLIVVILIALAIASAQPRQHDKEAMRAAAKSEPFKLIGKPLTPLHPVPIMQPPLQPTEK